LTQEGLISPSDPVSKYIPEFADVKVAVPVEPAKGTATPTSNAKLKGESKGKIKGKGKRKIEIPEYRLVPVDKPLTIHHLLTHTAGLKTGGLGELVSQVKAPTPDDTRATYVPRLAEVPLDFQPGTQRRYSPNGGITVMTRIIEIVSEAPFDKFVQERIFGPLEMNTSYYGVPRDKQSKRVVIQGVDFSKKNEGWGLFSTAEDYLHFQQMLLNGGKLFGNRVMSPDAVRMMSSNQVGDIDLISDPKFRKGMGHGYTVDITLDPEVAANYRGKGAFGFGGAAGTISWTDPENELVAVIMLQQPRGSVQQDFAKAIQEAIIE
jgi:CubicO group peptidase (beta-lactamase class C family)